ncbi:TIGR01777 family oxidoreductase [Alkalihalobacillus pseudalcaliphilus]|uniref:TIGR01777 family oxidoreductase n=1 Tax=Alkalihalobacillus pseudalcaliphilus TaxID=79884 RepID=UPI00064DC4AE|nr:TIGR01777 family oxidoreductase [Alkalihalobacillus pseudalcaliphilus]KMK74949.1 multidrug MFS transporter [Alkalihalobacillus pseudalcaliphilus]
MKIAITGGTGFIGTRLVNHLIEQGHEAIILTRNPQQQPKKENVTYVKWLQEDATPEKELEGIQAVYHLAGESIGNKRWTANQKEKILKSRIDSTRALMSILSKLNKKPNTLISASAIGFYGNSESAIFTEKDEPVDESFLTTVVGEWEKEVAKAQELGIRTVYARLGIVLHPKEGALKQMLLPYKLGIGGPLGSGKQWFSWVHIQDVISLFYFVLLKAEIDGPVNFTSPNPTQMNEFGRTIGSVINRPHWIPIPGLVMKLLLGEMSTLVIDGQKVLPNQALLHEYQFQYPHLKQALTDLLQE